MTEPSDKTLSGHVIEESAEITLVELCESCDIEIELVDELVEEGILEPRGGEHDGRRFHFSSVHRTRTVVHLRRDLGLNLAGAALALELLDRIDHLQAQLRKR